VVFQLQEIPRSCQLRENKTREGEEDMQSAGKRRNIDVVFDHWDNFEEQLAAWNCPV
jgi:hypothetical protein